MRRPCSLPVHSPSSSLALSRFAAWARHAVRRNDASHDMTHVLSVARNAIRICSRWDSHRSHHHPLLPAAVAAALAHEVCDKKYVDDVPSARRRLASALLRSGLDAETRRIVRVVVPLLSFSRRLRDGVPPLLQSDPPSLSVYLAVSDADMLEAVGATGTLRTFMFQACHGTGTDAALEHVRTKLLRCVDLFTDEWAASEAKARTARMVRICDEYEEEQRAASQSLQD